MAAPDELDCALDLMRRMPPTDIVDNLAGLIDLAPHLMEQLLSAVDQPLKSQTDAKEGKEYLLCDYNRDGDSYRSPWSNEYDPPLDYAGAMPSAKLRDFEKKANEVFETYREMYYEGGVSSVYTWDLEGGFACVILIKKEADGSGKKAAKGSWDSIHVVEVTEHGATAHYKITSTVMLNLANPHEKCGDVNLAGSLTRQTEADVPVDATIQTPHLINIGRQIEEMENKMRNSIEQIYFGKTKDIVVGDLRQSGGAAALSAGKNLAAVMASAGKPRG